MIVFEEIIARRVDIPFRQVKNTIELLEEGATIPFISRYRKEHTGSLDEVKITEIRDELNKLKDWFVESPHKELVAQCPAQHLFGDAWVGELAAMTVAARRQAILAQATASATSPPDENEDDAIVAPPALEMLISADGVCKAVFGGESYGQGEYVGGSTFQVVAVTKDAVTLRSGKDRTVTLNLWN
jgi:hypothetical protein